MQRDSRTRALTALFLCLSVCLSFLWQLRALLRDILPGDIGGELCPSRVRGRLQVLPRRCGQVREEPAVCLYVSLFFLQTRCLLSPSLMSLLYYSAVLL